MYKPTVNSTNLRDHNIALKTQEVINRCGFNSFGEKKELNIYLLSHNTGYSIKMSESCIYDDSLKKKLTTELKKELGRSVSLDTRHLYFGEKEKLV